MPPLHVTVLLDDAELHRVLGELNSDDFVHIRVPSDHFRNLIKQQLGEAVLKGQKKPKK